MAGVGSEEDVMIRSIVRASALTLAVLSLGATPALAGSHEGEASGNEKPEGSGDEKAPAPPSEGADGDMAPAEERVEKKAPRWPRRPRREGS